MKIVGLSAGIASGKNSVAEIFSKLGVKIFDADLIVHDLFINNKIAIKQIAKEFPQALKSYGIDRKIIAEIITKNPQKLAIIENIIHPLVRNNYQQFITINHKNNEKLVILNIPLLQEKKYYKTDKIIAIITDEEIRRNRYIKRSITDINKEDKIIILQLNEKFTMLKNQQISDEERIKIADYVIINNSNHEDLERQVITIFKKISNE
jgi:dephospho-CoA kinase